ncbi:hypothetical protein A3C37_01970 [Candidatus Peribacteria bacterium RIFCSPHIGHO2_02_FULL_53_20]|nr:MAG: hypothetical protein A3C37_01970 [Candidatus Peribacteria bacterium RIFCSPHIGHO2_02_FULL_53_20]OGJ68005.1 MAG: hypothetical protein A3B61_04870 [Candidatus Peribacteria bacterium RIFCSPLOWO2_01_FULL_53_10]
MDEHLLKIRPPVWLPLLVVLIAGGSYIAGKTIEVRGYQPTLISVDGEGKVTAVPDIAELTFGVATGPQKTAKAAMDNLSKTMTAAFEAVKALGIEEKDIATESLYLNPSYDWSDGKQTLRGYEANQQLRVKVRDLDKVSDVLSATTNAGANQAGGVQFTIDDPQGLRAEAREKAIKNAQEKAEVLAAQLGVELGDLKNFSEGGGYSPPVPYMMKSAMMEGVGGGMADAGVPLPAGEQEIQVNVNLTFEVED